MHAVSAADLYIKGCSTVCFHKTYYSNAFRLTLVQIATYAKAQHKQTRALIYVAVVTRQAKDATILSTKCYVSTPLRTHSNSLPLPEAPVIFWIARESSVKI